MQILNIIDYTNDEYLINGVFMTATAETFVLYSYPHNRDIVRYATKRAVPNVSLISDVH